MAFFTNEKHRSVLVISVVLLCMFIALVLRMIPALFIPPNGILISSGADVWYSMRQIEVMVANFPQYNWFDPMTAYPVGKTIDWGPFYPFLAAALCIISGASSRVDIINIAGWIVPVMATLMVPVTYKLGRLIWDWKAGIIAAGLVSVFSFTYFTQTAYGWTDHHGAEVFFVALFFLTYLVALSSAKQNPVDLKHPRILIYPVLFTGLAGILYFLGYLTSPTVLLSLLVIAVFTFIQFCLDYHREQGSEYLLLVNGLSFSCIVILEILFGFPGKGLSLTTYSVGHVYAMLGLIAETILLYSLARIFRKNRIVYYFSLAGVVIGGFILLQFLPALQSIRDQAVSLAFGSSVYSITVRETVGWTFSTAYEDFNLALILLAAGFVILIWSVVKSQRCEQVFLLAWLVVILVLTIPHQRFVFYLTVPVALTAAICTSEVMRLTWDGTGSLFVSKLSQISGQNRQEEKRRETGKKERKIKRSPQEPGNVTPAVIIKGAGLAAVIIITGMVFVTSAGQDYAYVAATPTNGISSDWIGTLDWMRSSTPPTGVDYFQNYDQQTFTYPNTSYGILAPWEQGHRITFFTGRIPITNPFQNHLGGKDGAAAFYLTENETTADAILSNLGGRYVATDLGTATDTFPSLIPWVTNTDNLAPYLGWFFVEDRASPSGLKKTHLLGDAYFQSMVVRLQIFDGAMVSPDTVQYVRYTVRQAPDSGDTAGLNGMARIISGIQTVNATQDAIPVSPEGAVLSLGDTYTDIYSSIPYQPVKKVPALTHYRLVYESSTNLSSQLFRNGGVNALPDIRLVKVFEFVKGAHIPGEGVIELNLVTNTGRTFVYRQESHGGEFVVPYPTDGGASGVRAAGPYHIAGTSLYITVAEEDVQNGNRVSGSGR